MRTGFAVEEVREDVQAQFIDNVDLTSKPTGYPGCLHALILMRKDGSP